MDAGSPGGERTADGELGEGPEAQHRSTDTQDRAMHAAWKALSAAYARAGIALRPSEVDRVARRFQLDGGQVAELELRAEALGWLERVKRGIDPDEQDRTGSVSIPDVDLLTLFRRDVGKITLLTYNDEIALGEAIAAGERAKESLGNPQLVGEQRERLAVTVQRGREAFDEFVRRNTPLAMRIAQEHVNLGLDYLDVLQWGLMGLMKAVERWDPHRGYRFTTYAYWWITQFIRRALADQGRLIRLPVHMMEQVLRMRRVRAQLRERLEREPHIAELAEALGVDRERAALYVDLDSDVLSLDLAVGDDASSTIGDFVSDAGADMDPETLALRHDRLNGIARHLSKLKPRERVVIIFRFGLGEMPQLTLEQIGDAFGVTRERVRQIEMKALRKLKGSMSRYD